MRICLFTPNFYPAVGGAEKAANLIANGLTQRGHDVTVLTRQQSEPAPDADFNVRYYRKLPKENIWPELYRTPLLQEHQKSKFEVVLAFYSYPLGYAAVKSRSVLKCPIVITPRGGDLYPNFHGLKKWRVPKTIAYGYANADRLIPVSNWLLERIKTITNKPLPPYDLVYNGIDVTAFQKDLKEATTSITEPIVEPPFLLHLARVAPVKRQDLAIDAIDRLRELFEKRDLRYAIVGEGELLDDIRKRIKQLDLEHIVKLLGTRTGTERDWLYANAMGFVSTSREEGLSNVSLEAMAAGLPMLASDIGPHQEVLSDQDWGMLFKSEDVDALTAALPKFIDSDLDAMSRTALELCQNYTLERMIVGYEESLTQAIEQFKA